MDAPARHRGGSGEQPAGRVAHPRRRPDHARGRRIPLAALAQAGARPDGARDARDLRGVPPRLLEQDRRARAAGPRPALHGRPRSAGCLLGPVPRAGERQPEVQHRAGGARGARIRRADRLRPPDRGHQRHRSADHLRPAQRGALHPHADGPARSRRDVGADRGGDHRRVPAGADGRSGDRRGRRGAGGPARRLRAGGRDRPGVLLLPDRDRHRRPAGPGRGRPAAGPPRATRGPAGVGA